MLRKNLVVLLAALATAACGGSSSSSGADDAVTFMASVASAYGERAAACGPTDAEYAASLVAVYLPTDQVREAVEAGRVGIDQAKAQACLDWLKAASCAELENNGAIQGCATAFVPKVAEGGLCKLLLNDGVSAECISGECVQEWQSCAVGGVCKSFAAEGEACDTYPTYRSCGPGLACGGDDVCVTAPAIPSTVGADCSGRYVCADGLYCVYSSSTSSYTCQAQAGLGEACSYGDQCKVGLSCRYDGGNKCVASQQAGDDCSSVDACVSGTACDGTKCVAYGTVGAACGYVNDASWRDCLGSYCQIPADSTTGVGTCAAYLGKGAACDPEESTPNVKGAAPLRALKGYDLNACGPGLVCDVGSETCIPLYCEMKG